MELPPSALLDRGYLAARARLIDPQARAGFRPGRARRAAAPSTFARLTNRGMMVSLIQSNYMGFGSGVVVPGTGISLQNRGAGFSLQPGHPNEIGGGKRPLPHDHSRLSHARRRSRSPRSA